MEVVSSSEVEYAREASGIEQSSGTELSDNILEEQENLQVDCFSQCLGTKIPFCVPESEMRKLEANNGKQSHNDNQSSPIYNGGTPREVSCIPIGSVSEQLTGANVVEQILQKVDHCLQTPEDKVSGDSYKENNMLINEHCSSLNDSSKGDLFFSVGKSMQKDPDQHRTNELLPCIDLLYGAEHRKETVISVRSSEVNEHVLNAEYSKKYVVEKDEGKTDLQPVSEPLVHRSSDSQLCGEELPNSSLVQPNIKPNRNNIEYDMPLHNESNKSLCGTDNLRPIMQNVETYLLNCNQEAESPNLESGSSEQDCTIALWVKWRGKWQTGIRCSRMDSPLPTLRAKPTHDRKKYSIVFFPHTRTYSWADMQLVCSINELPKPLAYGTHISWLALVEDLTVPRRYIMRKLAVSMLNISDQMHTEAVIESARKATYWKEFATEASCCRSYSDLGKMLVKLQRIILPGYINPDWLHKSFDSWLHQCQNAQSAESVELLTEQLVDSVLWNDVEELWNAPVQPDLGSEWRTWKQEAMKLFYTSHPLCSGGDSGQQNCDNYVSIGPQISRKRPKLEIRRSEVCGSEIEAGILRYQSKTSTMGFDSTDLQCKDSENSSPVCHPHEVKLSGMDAEAVSRNTADKIDIRNKDLNNVHQTMEVVNVSVGESNRVLSFDAELASLKKYRRCSAFIEAKGRQCGRWASDGDNYCCVHLRGQPSSNVFRREHSPLKALMCEGTTVHGKKCKHKAREGSTFCKKHEFHTSPDAMDCHSILNSFANKLKRKHEGNNLSENILSPHGDCKNEIQASFHENLVPVVIGEALDEGNCLMNKSKLFDALPAGNACNADNPRCIGYGYHNDDDQCRQNAKRHTLYCEKHLPNFLKRARDGKSRLISKDVFISLLRNCTSRKEKINLHRACELLYGYMKSCLSHQKLISNGDHVGWILSEVSKDTCVGEYLLKLVSSERHKMGRLLGLDTENDKLTLSFETKPVSVTLSADKGHENQMAIRCKICEEEFSDNQTLGIHWREIHKKEAQWLFRGYACAICMNSFTNRKVLEAHVTEKHGVQFLEHSILLRCMSCNSHLPTLEKLWEHILSFHSIDLRHTSSQQNLSPKQSAELEIGNKPYDCAAQKEDGLQRYICKLCGLKFDLLPDLGRHHQAAHLNSTSMSRLRKNKTNRHLKTSKFHHSRFKKGTGAAFRIKKTNFGMKKHFQASSSVIAARLRLQTQASETLGLGSLLDSQCSTVAKTLFAEVHRTKFCPSNTEILASAKSACCQTYIHNVLLEKYGTPSRNMYIKAAKFCSELNIPISWHLEGFTCPKGCKPLRRLNLLGPLIPLSDELVEPCIPLVDHATDGGWEMDECHYILSPTHFCRKTYNSIVLCEDVSFGKESIPVACVIDENLKHLLKTSGDDVAQNSFPWLGFSYVTERLLDSSLCFDTTSSQLGCGCQQKCYAGTCDHVYLFNNDYENAKDVRGKSMHGRFPYDERGQIILEEGYLVYECNTMCSCDSTCQNRVLQNGLRIKLEVFKTERKGWAVRAGEPISRGTFVCEYIGEVLNNVEANKRGERYDNEGCSYLYDIDAHIDDGERLSEVLVPYVVDATKHGNVSRFINHSCSPNLVNYQVLVESMDCQLARIGLYASRDIAAGEELVYDYRYKLLPGDGCSCHCGSSVCRGRLY